MKILVTGGLGYIGSHTVIELINNGHEVVILDNLINSKLSVLEKIEKISGTKPIFYQINVTDSGALKNVFEAHNFEGVTHFAGLKAVGESVIKPLEYYHNNLVSTLNICDLCVKHGVRKIVFSSSATVYGDQLSPLHEGLVLQKTSNPYGETKAMSERILSDAVVANQWLGVSLLRYFNPVGAHESGSIGEDPNGTPNNLMPYVTRVAKGALAKLSIFGDDYETVDGTGVRDYIHVVDLAKGHVRAIEMLDSGVHIYNLGTGKGTSVLELVDAFMRVNGVAVPYEVVGRRAGDIATCFADPSKADRELGWKAEKSLDDMVRDAWGFEIKNK